MMRRIRLLVYAAGLVVGPLLLAVYWLLYPAYGDVHAADIAADIGAAPGRTGVADAFAFAAAFLAVPGVLACLQLLRVGSPRLAYTGCGLALTGWMAILPLLTLDVVARRTPGQPQLFEAVYTSGAIIALSALAFLHIIGGVLIGVALIRTGLVPRPLAIAATLAPVVHFASNLAGVLWLDIATWIVIAGTGVVLLPGIARFVAADEAVLSGEQRGGSSRAHADLGVDMLDVP